MVATVVNTGIAGGDASANASAGDDTIEAGEGNNLVAGEALATGANGGAKVDNTATATEGATATAGNRSEEHTSELQSLMRISYAVFCLKQKKIRQCHLSILALLLLQSLFYRHSSTGYHDSLTFV